MRSEAAPLSGAGPARILFCARYGIGDLVMELPALSALREACPRARLTTLAAPPAHELLEGDDRTDELVLISRWGLRHRWDQGSAGDDALKTWLRERSFDLVLDPDHAPPAIGRAVRAAGIPTLGAAQATESRALAGGADAREAIRQAVTEGWGIPVPPRAGADLRLREDERAGARRLLADVGFGGARPVALAPVASSPLKRWPLERFSRVAEHVMREAGAPVVILEGPEACAGERVRAGIRARGQVVRIGALHLRATAALLEHCRALVCHDTGLLHVAAAVGTPIVGVFGPTRPGVYLPSGPRARGAAPRDVPCGWRNTGTLFPPDCITSGRCLIGRDGCIDRTALADVLAGLADVLADRPDRRVNGRPPRERSLQPGSRASPCPSFDMAPNRLLDLTELDRPEVRRVLDELDALVAADPVSYLHPGKRWEYPWALERAGLRPASRVLDVGAGDSILPVCLAKRGHHVTAVDVAFDGSLGEHHGVDIDYVHADMTEMPLPSEAFDAVFCISAIEHLPERSVPAALAEIRRVLRRGAPLLLTTDYYEDAEAEIWHRSEDGAFRVEWTVFDEERLRRHVLDARGWQVEGALDLDVDWNEVKPRMRAFHGYPYTSVGVKLVRT